VSNSLDSNKIRCALVAYTINSKGGSEPKIAWNLLECALANNFVVTIFVPDSIDRDAENELRLLPIEIIKVPLQHRKFYRKLPAGNRIKYINWNNKVSSILRSRANEFDLGHQLSYGNLFLGSAFRNSGIPFIFGPGGGLNRPILKAMINSGLLLVVWEIFRLFLNAWISKFKFSKESLRNASLVLASNFDTLTKVQRLGATNVELMIQEAMEDTVIISRTSKPKTSIIVWAGRFLPGKLPELAIEAFAKALKELPNKTSLVMAGDGPLLEKCRRLSTELGIQDQVIFLGRISWTELQNLMRCATAFLFTSGRDTFGSQVLEACAAGLPIIGIEGQNYQSWFTESRTFASSKSKKSINDSLRNSIVQVLSWDSKSWVEVSQLSHQFALKHSISRKSREIHSHYTSVAGRENG